MGPTNIINAETVAKCITTLIHNTNDPNIYRILEGNDIEQYLSEQKVPFDSPNYYERYIEEEVDDEENLDDDDDDDNDKDKDKEKHNIISVGFSNNDTATTKDELIEDVNEYEEERGSKVL